MANFFDQFDAAPPAPKADNFFDRFDPGYQAPEEPGDVWRGVKESFQQLPQLGYGILAGAGAAAENVVGEGGIATGIKKAGVKGYTEWGDKIAAGSKPSDSIDYSLEQAKQGDFGSLVDWLQHGFGYVGGQGLQMLATAGIGFAGGKFVAGTAAKQIAEGMVAKEAARLTAESAGKNIAADQIAKAAVANVAGKFASIGMNTALGGAAVGMEGGEIFGGLTQQAEKDGRLLTGAELGKAFGATIAAGGLEFVGDKLGLDIVLGKSRFLKPTEYMKGIGGRASRGVIAAGMQAPIEAATEYGQTLIEEYGKGNDPTGDDALKQARESAWLGALGGTVIGGVGGAIHGAKERPAEKPITDGIDKIANAGSVDEAISAAAQIVSGKSSEPTPAERIASVKASVDMDALRAKYGDSATEFLNSLVQAQNPRAPSAVREKHLQAVETLLFEMNASRAEADPLALGGPPAVQPALGYEGAPPQIGMGSTPTGALRVGPDGVAVPETAADVTQDAEARRADIEQRDGLTAQAPIGGTPGAGVLVGEGAATPAERAAPLAESTDQSPRLLTGPTDAAEPSTQAPAPVVEQPGTGRAPMERGEAVLPGVETDPERALDEPAAAPAAGSANDVPVGSGLAEPEQALTQTPAAAVAQVPAQAGGVIPAGLNVTFGGKTYPVESVDDAQAKWIEFRDKSRVGVSEIGNGVRVIDGAGRFVARISYNGRVWDSEDDGTGGGRVVKEPPRYVAPSGAKPYADMPPAEKAAYDAANGITPGRREDAAGRLKDQVEALRKKKAEPVAPAVEAPAAEAAQVPVTKKRPPKSFRKKQRVTTPVFDEETGSFKAAEVDAETALKALDDDIGELQSFLKCLGGS